MFLPVKLFFRLLAGTTFLLFGKANRNGQFSGRVICLNAACCLPCVLSIALRWKAPGLWKQRHVRFYLFPGGNNDGVAKEFAFFVILLWHFHDRTGTLQDQSRESQERKEEAA